MPDEWAGDEHVLNGDELAPYRSSAGAVCWWCGSPAATQEHKFKRTDLERMWPVGDPYLVHGDGTGDRLSKVRSARKSPQVRFLLNLCARCNNARSQPFDRAYDLFAEYVWTHLGTLRWRRHIDAASIYGGDWQAGLQDLTRYVVKHAGCRVADGGFPVPLSFREVLNGSRASSAGLEVLLFKDRDLSRWRARAARKGIDAAGLHLLPEAAHVSQSRKVLTSYNSGFALGYVGLLCQWREGAAGVGCLQARRRLQLRWRHRLPGPWLDLA